MSIISSRFSYSVLLSAAVASECVMAGVCLTNSSEVVLGADVDGVSGHKFEGFLRKSVQATTIHFQQDPSQSNLLRVCRLGSCSQEKISTSLWRSLYGSRPHYAERTASTACGSWSNRVWWMSLPNSTHLLQMAVTWTCKLCLLVLIKYPKLNT